MIFDKEKNEIVKRLKKLSKLKDRTEYQELKLAIEKKYNVSGRTVERWMAARVPGQRKSRKDAGKERVKIKPTVKKKISELVSSGRNIKDVQKLTGVSKRKIDKIRSQKSEVGNQNEVQEPEKIESSAFGSKAKELFEKLFEMDLIADDKGVKINVGTEKDRKYLIIPKADVQDVCMILANVYNRAEFARANKYPADRQALREKMILHLLEQQIRLAMESSSTKDIEALTRMHKAMKNNIELTPNIVIVEKICKELKPDISFEDIVKLIEKHSDE